jgi:ABC-type sugar transport system substrate-binding protein
MNAPVPLRRTALLAIALLMPACKWRPAAEPAETAVAVHYLAAGDRTAYQQMQRLVLTRLLAEADARLNLVLQAADGSATRQAQQLRAAAREKPDFLLIDPVEATALAAPLAELRKAGTRVIGLGESAASMDCDTVLICPQRELGRLAGDLVRRALQRRAQELGLQAPQGRVVQIRGDEEEAGGRARDEGFRAELAKAPGLVLVHDAPGFWTREQAAERVREALRLQGGFEAVYAHDDLMAAGAIEALPADVRENVLVVGTDGHGGRAGGYTLVNAGMLDASIYRPLLVDFAVQLILKSQREPAFRPKPQYVLKPRTVTPRELDDIRLNGMAPYPEP